MAIEEDKAAPIYPERRSASRGGLEPRRRRLRDRLEGEEEVRLGPVLVAAGARQADLRNPLLLCDDDLRQTARALQGIETYVLSVLQVLEREDPFLTRADMIALLDEDVEERLDGLADSLGSLRRSLQAIAGKL